jgi:hypothetical protein
VEITPAWAKWRVIAAAGCLLALMPSAKVYHRPILIVGRYFVALTLAAKL